MDRRVVITGLGLVTPVGTGVDKSWTAICAGESGVGMITKFDTTDFDTKIAAEVKDFHAEAYLPKKEAKRTVVPIERMIFAQQYHFVHHNKKYRFPALFYLQNHLQLLSL